MRLAKLLTVLILLAGLTLEFDVSDKTRIGLSIAHAQVPNTLPLSWVPPQFYTDGTPLLEQDLDFYTLYCDGGQTDVIDSIIGTYSYDLDLTQFQSGDHACALSVTSLLGEESVQSNSVNFTIGARTPGAPSLTSP